MSLNNNDRLRRDNLLFLLGFQSICIKAPLIAKAVFMVEEDVLQIFINASRSDLEAIADSSEEMLWTLRRAENHALWETIVDDLLNESEAQQNHLRLALAHTIGTRQQSIDDLHATARLS